MSIRAIRAIAFLCILIACAGCEIIDQSRVQKDDTDTLPWNRRAGWEDSTIGVPF
jgi:hypothetical protein